MGSLANAVQKANREYLKAGLHYASLTRAQAAASVSGSTAGNALDADQHEAEMRWRLARKNVYIAFANFAGAFYRMMEEPVKRQNNVPELNNLMIQFHVLALQISAAVPILASLATVPEGVQKSLDAVGNYLEGSDAHPPASIETEGELASLAYPLRQMVKAAQLVQQEMRGVATP